MDISTHYSQAQNMASLMKWAQQNAAELNRRLLTDIGGDCYPIFCYRGMSGVAYATMLAMEWHHLKGKESYGMIYVRKEEEVSHGSPVEMILAGRDKFTPDKRVLVFVDDLVETGATQITTLKTANKLLGDQRGTLVLHSGKYTGVTDHGVWKLFPLSDLI